MSEEEDYIEFKPSIFDCGELYDATGEEWGLRVSVDLTEPTCTTITIRPEGLHISRYRIDVGRDCDLMAEIQKLILYVREEVVEKKNKRHLAPFTNPDDEAFLNWLKNGGDFPQSKVKGER